MWKPWVCSALLLMMTATESIAQKIVIAHRGASGYLPEHTLEAKAMAYAMGADFIEQDVVMTADDQLIVLHDVTLDRTTNVSEIFPRRAREDGRYYAIDFTLEEIRQLDVTEGFQVLENGEKQVRYADRFPMDRSAFEIPTLQEEIELIQGLNHSTGRDIGIYPEIKQPAFHRQQGKDISTAVVRTLKQYGYTSARHRVFLQTFDFDELRRLHDEILPAEGVDIPLVQLIDSSGTYPWPLDRHGMERLAVAADAIGPAHELVIAPSSTADDIRLTGLVAAAHAAGMQVHPYTYRRESGQLPGYAGSLARLLQLHYFMADVDGVFTDFPDVAVHVLTSRDRMGSRAQPPADIPISFPD